MLHGAGDHGPHHHDVDNEPHLRKAKESVTVPAGTFNTCRYRVSDADGSSPSTMWLIVGKGIMAKSLTQTTQGAQTIQLKSGTYNGGAL